MLKRWWPWASSTPNKKKKRAIPAFYQGLHSLWVEWAYHLHETCALLENIPILEFPQQWARQVKCNETEKIPRWHECAGTCALSKRVLIAAEQVYTDLLESDALFDYHCTEKLTNAPTERAIRFLEGMHAAFALSGRTDLVLPFATGSSEDFTLLAKSVLTMSAFHPRIRKKFRDTKSLFAQGECTDVHSWILFGYVYALHWYRVPYLLDIPPFACEHARYTNSTTDVAGTVYKQSTWYTRACTRLQKRAEMIESEYNKVFIG